MGLGPAGGPSAGPGNLQRQRTFQKRTGTGWAWPDHASIRSYFKSSPPKSGWDRSRPPRNPGRPLATSAEGLVDELRVVQQVAEGGQSRQPALLLRLLQLREQLRDSEPPEGHRSPAGIHRSAALPEGRSEKTTPSRCLVTTTVTQFPGRSFLSRAA